MAIAYPRGLMKGTTLIPSPYISEREISPDFPADVIGECVTGAIQQAVTDGYDPQGDEKFCVVVSFQ